MIIRASILAIIVLAFGLNLKAQDTLYVYQNNGETFAVPVNDIDSLTFFPKPTAVIPNDSALVDADGNVYKTVTIGTQVWMAENLKTTRYNDGTSIPLVSNTFSWGKLDTHAYCWYNNDIGNKPVYGALYNWYCVGAEKLCPLGWHVPSDAEWTVLEVYIQNNGYIFDGTLDTDNSRGTNNNAALSLAATKNWAYSNIEGAAGNDQFPQYANKTGFTAQPGGNRTGSGIFDDITQTGYWWTSSIELTSGVYRNIYYQYSNIYRDSYFKMYGLSVRCLKD